MKVVTVKTIVDYFLYCPYCGVRLDYVYTDAIRPTCKSCGYRQFMNPTVGVAVVVLKGNRVLLGKRKSKPFAGRWCIPCGHVELGEDIREAAVREFLEETGLLVRLGEVIDVHSNWHNPNHLTVGVWFKGEVIGGTLRAGSDLTDVNYFSIKEIYSLDMAFPTDLLVIEKILKEVCDEDATCR